MSYETERDWTISYTVFFKSSPEEINQIKERMANLQNALGLGRSGAVKEIFQAGMTALEVDLGENENLDGAVVAIAKEVDAIKKHEARLKQLEKIYQSRGLDEFTEFCKDNGIDDFEDFLEAYTWRSSDLRWSQRAKTWLGEYLSDGQPHATSDIRAAAEEADILDGSESAWGRMRTLASREGLTSCPEYGCWQVKRM